jgi:hypothetical protein
MDKTCQICYTNKATLVLVTFSGVIGICKVCKPTKRKRVSNISTSNKKARTK